MKTVRNNPWRPRRVYIEIVFTLLCKHLLQDGTLKCEQNSTSTLLDAAVLLQSDKQFECGVHAVCMYYLSVTFCVLAFSVHYLCLHETLQPLRTAVQRGGDILRLSSFPFEGNFPNVSQNQLFCSGTLLTSKLSMFCTLCCRVWLHR